MNKYKVIEKFSHMSQSDIDDEYRKRYELVSVTVSNTTPQVYTHTFVYKGGIRAHGSINNG